MPATLHFDELVATLPTQDGKVVAITGCTSGMGFVLACTAARLGARVVMLNRPSERADRALAEVQRLGTADLVPCDLASLASVRAAGVTLRERLGDTGLDVLVNNAGVMGMTDLATEDGFDLQMQANHLSHFLLVHEVWPLLEEAAQQRGEARVVNHSSGARNRPDAEMRQPYLERNGGHLGGDRWPGFQKWRRYQQSKLANLLFTYALQDHADQRPGNGVKALCAHPGPADSGLQAKTTRAGGTTILDRYIINSTLKIAQSQEDGTCGLARAAFDPGAKGGDFFGPDAKTRTGPALLLPPERDPAGEKMLWDASLASTGITRFFP
ncbi:SDR family NAD(P)-dependent oxidoreductase [Albibacillus kandeliae]|uniref:SDR family NAD(P)-dependent oxidoreductase n=1 Tax=Albibacillus kandeliae TaxID=2174228 RepID=UPI000D69A391|nr:SDR family NAD(P)-dependent oxidoreductase [Albibacillus kandeliae]